MTATKPASRRRAPRLSVDRPGSLKGRLPRAVTVIDLSLTGCLVRCDTLLVHGAILDLDVMLDDGPLPMKVRVVESSLDGAAGPEAGPGCLAGLEFLGLPPREDARLRRFLDEEKRRRRSADASPR
jgi:PilZ domain-containing protein